MADKILENKVEVSNYVMPNSFEDEDGKIDKNKKMAVLHERYKEVDKTEFVSEVD